MPTARQKVRISSVRCEPWPSQMTITRKPWAVEMSECMAAMALK